MKYEISKHPLADRDPRFNYWEVWRVRGNDSELVKHFKTEKAARSWATKHS